MSKMTEISKTTTTKKKFIQTLLWRKENLRLARLRGGLCDRGRRHLGQQFLEVSLSAARLLHRLHGLLEEILKSAGRRLCGRRVEGLMTQPCLELFDAVHLPGGQPWCRCRCRRFLVRQKSIVLWADGGAPLAALRPLEPLTEAAVLAGGRRWGGATKHGVVQVGGRRLRHNCRWAPLR